MLKNDPVLRKLAGGRPALKKHLTRVEQLFDDFGKAIVTGLPSGIDLCQTAIQKKIALGLLRGFWPHDMVVLAAVYYAWMDTLEESLRDLLDEGVSFREVTALAAKQESETREHLVNAMMARAVKQYSRVGGVVFLREIELDKEESALQEIDLVREKARYRREFDVFLKNWGEQ